MSLENKYLTLDLYYKIINVMPYGMIVADKNGKFILWNTKSFPIFNENLLNSTKENWVKDFGIYHIDKETLYKTEDLPMVKSLNGQSIIGEKMFVKHEGIPEGTFLKVSSFPIMNDDGTGIQASVTVFDDITQQQLLYDSIIFKINELEKYLKDIKY